jgi:hypothetical protein
VAEVVGSTIAAVLIPVMMTEGVRRVVMTSSPSVVATRPRLMVGLAWMRFRREYADLARAEEHAAKAAHWTGASCAGPCSWTSRPPVVSTSTSKPTPPAALAAHPSRYAMTLLNVAEDTDFIHRSPGVGGHGKNA